MDTITYILSKKYTDNSLAGVGALKGAPCKIQGIVDNADGTHDITFSWKDDNGISHTSILTVHDGEKGEQGEVGARGEKGLKGDKGDTGLGIASIVQVAGGASIIINFDDGSQSEPIAIPTVEGPKGDRGDTGSKGDKGDAGRGIDSITKLEDTSQIVVHYDDGTDEEPITIPTIKGDSPTVEVGTTKTVSYGSPAKVLETPTATGVKLDFEIPQGRPGEGGGGSGDVSSVNNIVPDEYGNVQLTKTDLALGNVDNTADVDKPISNAQALVNTNQSTTNEDFETRITNLENNPVNPTQFDIMPDATEHPQEIIQFIGASTTSYNRGYFYRSTPKVVSGELTYEWVQADVQPSYGDYEDISNKPSINGVELTGDKTNIQLGIQGQFQFSTLPEASADYLSSIVEYIGTTTADYKVGYFYQCQYNSETASYEWVEMEVSANESLANRISTLETNQGDMATLEIPNATSLVEALNVLNSKGGILRYEYVEPNLIIYYQDGHTFQLSIGTILNETQIGELQNVIDDTIADGQVLQYDASIQRYKPYAILLALQNLLTESKNYTDLQISSSMVAGAYVCDEKPEYDSDNDTVIYKQSGVTKTTTQTDARFYYYSSGDPFCTSWIDDIEFTFSVSNVNFEDYVNKNTDLVNTYTEEMLDKTKVPTVASLDALLAIVKQSLALKINKDSIVDNLTSQDAESVLSAKQGKILKDTIDLKQDQIQYAVMPSAEASKAGQVLEYVGTNSEHFKKGYFYQCVYQNDEWLWKTISFKALLDNDIVQNGVNPVSSGTLYTALDLKQDKTLSAPLTINGVNKTTVEETLSALNTYVDKKSEQYNTLPSPSINLLGKLVQYTGTSTATLNHGYFYECKIVAGSDPIEYAWVQVPTQDTVAVDNATIVKDNLTGEISAVKATNSTLGIVKAGDGVDIDNAGSIKVTSRLEETSVLATPSASNEGKSYLLVADQEGYQKGGIYQCQSDGEIVPTYSWELINANSMETETGHTIEDEDGTLLTQRDTLKFVDSNAYDDNGKTNIEIIKQVTANQYAQAGDGIYDVIDEAGEYLNVGDIAGAKANDNLLANAHFNVNTTGFTSKTYSGWEYGKTIDSYTAYFGSDGGSVSYSNKEITLTKFNGEGSRAWLYQFLDNSDNIKGKQVCLSARINGTVYSGSAIVPLTDAYEKVTIIDNDDLKVALVVSIGSNYYTEEQPSFTDAFIVELARKQAVDTSVTIQDLKLEPGDHSTLSQELEPNYNLEVIKCNGVMRSNRNLLDNAWFTINQKGFTSTSTSGSILDRWKMNFGSVGGTVTKVSNGLELSPTDPTWISIYQKIENISDIVGKCVTASFMLANGTIYSGSGIVPSSDNFYFNISGVAEVYISNSNSHFMLATYNNITIKAVKLELGSESTLHLDIAPDYATELLKCQRYFYRTGSRIGIGYAQSAASFICMMELPTIMRTTPSLSYSGNLMLYFPSGYTDKTPTAISESYSGKTVEMTLTSSGMTAGIPARLIVNNGYIDFNAEL